VWSLPWEKLPPLVVGPLLLLFGAALLFGSYADATNAVGARILGGLIAFFGLLVTAYGLSKKKDDKAKTKDLIK
jgi:hypothetical protein